MRDVDPSAPDPRPDRAHGGSPVGAADTRPQRARRAVAHGLGELLITLGVVTMLFVVYQVFYTNFEANRVQGAVKDELRESWTQPISAGRRIPGDALGILYIERLGENWEKPLVEGVELDQLARGVGHFPRSAMPGKVGNFAIAGHRATKGEPFAYLDRLRPKAGSWWKRATDGSSTPSTPNRTPGQGTPPTSSWTRATARSCSRCPNGRESSPPSVE